MKTRSVHDRGQSMVEFALILPIFILLMVGIFDFGRAIYAYNTINNAAREAARLGIVDQTVAQIQARAANQAVALGIAAGDVSVQFVENAGGGACTQLGSDSIGQCSVIVQVPYDYVAATPLIGNLVGVINMAGESQFRLAANCREPDKPNCPLGQ